MGSVAATERQPAGQRRSVVCLPGAAGHAAGMHAATAALAPLARSARARDRPQDRATGRPGGGRGSGCGHRGGWSRIGSGPGRGDHGILGQIADRDQVDRRLRQVLANRRGRVVAYRSQVNRRVRHAGRPGLGPVQRRHVLHRDQVEGGLCHLRLAGGFTFVTTVFRPRQTRGLRLGRSHDFSHLPLTSGNFARRSEPNPATATRAGSSDRRSPMP
jgi:hypothetical protein